MCDVFDSWRHKRLGVFQRWMSCKNIYLSIYKLVCNGSFLDIALRMFLVCFFKQTNKFCPNLIVYFGKVRWYKNNYYQINYLRITNFNEFIYKAPNLCVQKGPAISGTFSTVICVNKQKPFQKQLNISKYR